MDINDNVISKLLFGQIGSMLSRKAVYPARTGASRNEISQSTLGYWIRKIQSEIPETGPASDPVFAKLPSEQDLQFNGSTGNHSVTILLSENIRIEIDADCPSRLLATLLQALKIMLDFSGSTTVYSGMRGYRPPQELHRSGSDHQTEIPSRPVLPLYVRILQS